ncbi:hypothetical protein MHU86_13199 [Fragilaria crotonensis]|nr:hypothetical protein MHU86_13199 [Fragilaria crotonensis]
MAIHVTDVLQVDLKGKQDTAIMDPDRLSRYSRVQQRDINLVRLYLQCFKLSDLCCYDHRKISQHLLGVTGLHISKPYLGGLARSDRPPTNDDYGDVISRQIIYDMETYGRGDR